MKKSHRIVEGRTIEYVGHKGKRLSEKQEFTLGLNIMQSFILAYALESNVRDILATNFLRQQGKQRAKRFLNAIEQFTMHNKVQAPHITTEEHEKAEDSMYENVSIIAETLNIIALIPHDKVEEYCNRIQFLSSNLINEKYDNIEKETKLEESICFRATKEQKTIISNMAEERGMSTAEFMRSIVDKVAKEEVS